MTDSTLRTLERHYRESGAPDAEVAWLRARLRTGERSPIRCKLWPDGGHPDPEFLIPGGCPSCSGTGYRPLRDGVELAAYLGHGPAREALGAWVEDFQHRTATRGAFWTERLAWRDGGGTRYRMLHPDDLADWLQGLTHWGHETTVRAALAVAREAHGGDGCPTMDAIRAVEAWLEDPSEANRKRCDLAAIGLGSSLRWAWATARIAAGSDDPGRDRYRRRDLLGIVATDSNLPAPRVRTVIRDALVPWALGYTRRER